MNVTVSEALRMKKELAEAIQTLMRQPINYGLTTENGEVTNDHGNTQHDLIPHLTKLDSMFSMSEHLNSTMAAFNVNTGLADAVRAKANIEVFIQQYRQALERSSVQFMTRYEIVGGTRVPIKQEFTPFMTKLSMKEALRVLKERRNGLLSKVDKLNQAEITFNFTKAQFDEMIAEA